MELARHPSTLGPAPRPMCLRPGVFLESRLAAHCQGRPQGCPGSHPVSCPGRREHSLCSDSSSCLQIQEQTLGASPLHVSPGLPTLHSLLLLHRLLWLLDCPELSPLQLSLRTFCSSSHHRDLPWPTWAPSPLNLGLSSPEHGPPLSIGR